MLFQAPGYVLAQISGGIIGAALVRGIIGHEGGLGTTTPLNGAGQSFGLEIIMTFVLMFVITSVSSDSRSVRNGKIGSDFFPDFSFFFDI